MSGAWGRFSGLRRGFGPRARLGYLLVATLATIGLIAVQFSGGPERGLPPDSAAGLADLDDAAPTLPADPQVLFVGDEWTAGEGASAPRHAFAHLAARELGWEYRLDAVPGTGWAHASTAVPDSAFADRVSRLAAESDFAPDLVVVSAQMASPRTGTEVGQGMRDTVTLLRERVPDAVVVVVLPYANPRGLDLCSPLASARVLCLDTYGEQWLPEQERPSYLAGAAAVPNDAGHARFAALLVADLRRDLLIG